MRFVAFIVCIFVCYPAFAGDVEMRAYRNINYIKNTQDSRSQLLDIYCPLHKTARQRPVVIFIHGGGWTDGDKGQKAHSAKRDFFVRHDMVFVSINYRMAPHYSFPAYPRDVAAAISYIIDNIAAYGGDPGAVFLSGHSAGGHLAALVSTDDGYLKAYGKELNAIRGVILIDGAGYNIPGRFEAFGDKKEKKWVRTMYERAFGTNPDVWKNASPIHHVRAKGDIPPFLVFSVTGRKEAQIQCREFVSALTNAEVPAKLVPIENSSHRKINISFGARLGFKEKMTLAFIDRYHSYWDQQRNSE